MNRQLRGNLPPNEKANGKNRFLSLLLLFMAFVSVPVYAQDVKVYGMITLLLKSQNRPPQALPMLFRKLAFS